MPLTFLFTLVIVLVAAVLGVVAHKTNTSDEFWLNNRKTGLVALVATLVSTQVGAGTVMGIASSTLQTGTGYGVLVLFSTVLGFVLVALCAPKIRAYADAQGIVTLPEFIGARFGVGAERMAALVTVVAYIGFLGGQIVALAAFLQTLGLGSSAAVIGLAGVGAVFYCALSGVKGDIAADGWFFLVMLLSLCCLAYGVFSHWPQNALQLIPANIVSPATFGGYSTLIIGALLGGLLPFVQMELWLRVFAARDAGVAKRALTHAAFWCAPFCVLPVLVGFYAVATRFVPKTPDTVLLEIAQHILPPVLGAFVVASLTAIILSTTNTFTLVVAGVLTRTLLPYKQSLPAQKGAVLAVGMAATAVALMAQSLVGLILGAAYVLIALCPTMLAALFNWNIKPIALITSMGAGAVAAAVSYPYLGAQAFLPNLIVSFTIAGLGWIAQRRKMSKV